MADKWNGKGRPPSKQAAIEWMRAQGVTRLQHYWVENPGGSKATKDDADNLDALGRNARSVVTEYTKDDANTSRAQTKATSKDAVAAVKNKADKNADGTISADEKQVYTAQGGNPSDLEAFLAGGPGASSGKGAPLLPYAIPTDLDPTTLKFDNRSRNSDKNKRNEGRPAQIGARYYEADTLTPLKWSEERRAELQRTLFGMGLYGDKQIRLGSWSKDDQAIFAELLTSANVNGRTMADELDEWKRVPPAELLAQLKSQAPAKPTLHVSNPVDIRAAAAQADQSTMGGGNLPFVQGAPAAYQPTEIAAQQAVTTDQAAGGGGTVTDQASAPEFFADKARREHPVEVGGYSYLKAFDQFANFIRGGSSA